MKYINHKFEADRLMVIIPDRLSGFLSKGEVTERYYNPGELFKEVHIVMTNDDRPNLSSVQKMVGEAKLFLHNLPITRKHLLTSFGWRPLLLRKWANPIVELAKEIRPSLIRCHGNDFNTYVANRIKGVLGIPYVVSLHINLNEDVKKRSRNWRGKARYSMMAKIERIGLQNSDYVLPVYKSIIPYIEKMGVTKYEVAYNVLNPNFLEKKTDYGLHSPIRILSVGRVFKEKNPENIIKALKYLPNVHLTIVGDGSYSDHIRDVTLKENVEEKVTFIKSIPNDELCNQLKEYDIFALHSEYWEINKSILEALLTGLPVVINRRIGKPVPEFENDYLLLVNNSVEEYLKAMKKLIDDNEFREQLGRKAYKYAQENWAPSKTEEKYVEIYRRILSGD